MKLYWRYKKDGKWTWKRCTDDDFEWLPQWITLKVMEEEE